jgi:hypothetical protein
MVVALLLIFCSEILKSKVVASFVCSHSWLACGGWGERYGFVPVVAFVEELRRGGRRRGSFVRFLRFYSSIV